MPLYTTPDGRYTYAIETPNQGDGNSAVYDNWRGVPVWDRWSYEAGLGGSPVVLPPVAPLPVPVPETPPEPAGNWRRPPIQVTDASDGTFEPRMMSYWANAFVTGNKAFVFAGHVGDEQPRFFEVNLVTGTVDRLGPLIGFVGTTEGWSWTRDGWIVLCDGPRLRKVSPFTNEAPVIFDISEVQGIPKNSQLWQPHSSDDGQTHSATVEQIVETGSYPKVGTVVFWHGQIEYFPARGVLDESAISGDGGYLIIKEDDDNRVITMGTKDTRMIRDGERALGHSDVGPDYMVGEADKPDPGMCGWWDLRQPLTPGRFHPLFPTLNMGYVSVRAGRILHSSETELRLIDRESGAITPLIDHGVRSDNYDDRVKANLDHSGRVATYMVNRQVYLLVLPA